MTTPRQRPWQGGWRDGLSYGALGLPLAFVALPLYVQLPNHYATAFGIPLATLGALLLGARLLDAVADPLIGRFADRWLGASPRRALLRAAAAAVLLAAGFHALFFPAVTAPQALLAWCAVMLAVTYLSYSVLGVLHQAWGARLGGDESQRSRIVAWREGLALVGVLVASVLPAVAGFGVASATFALLLALGLLAWSMAPAPAPAPAPSAPPSLALPLHTPAFRRLLAVYLVNGIASAVPATLVLFFIRDRLQAPAYEPLFLASYFAAGALAMPLWVRLVARIGLVRSWLAGMALAVASFVWAATLGAGDVTGYVLVCLASGVALGADLALPGALLAGVVQRAGHGGQLEGGYFGWWNFATKLNLALAAGLALPALQALGYAPGRQDAAALQALTVTYCLLPCVLKLLAAALLWRSGIDTPPARDSMKRRLFALLPGAGLLAACASPSPADYAAEKPVLDLKTYFNGALDAHGIFTDRSGKVVRRFVVRMTGTWQGNQGTLDEAFTYSDGKTERRVWKLVDEGGGRYTGRADDVVGTAQGVAAGNALNWRYTLRLPVDGSVYEVQFDDWMYLMDDRVMLNKAQMSKFGIHLGEVTLAFFKK